MRAGFNRRPGRSDARCDRWRNRCVYIMALAVVHFRLAVQLWSLTVAGMRPMMPMRMSKRPQKSAKRTGLDNIAEAQKREHGKSQNQPRRKSVHNILPYGPVSSRVWVAKNHAATDCGTTADVITDAGERGSGRSVSTKKCSRPRLSNALRGPRDRPYSFRESFAQRKKSPPSRSAQQIIRDVSAALDMTELPGYRVLHATSACSVRCPQRTSVGSKQC